MSDHNVISEIIANFEIINKSDINYIEVIRYNGENFTSREEKLYNTEFSPIDFNQIAAENPITDNNNNPFFDIEMDIEEKKTFIRIFPCHTGVAVTEYITFQSSKPLSPDSEKFAQFLYKALLSVLEQEKVCDPSTNKYKIQLMKLREMQAKLFPSFSDIQNYDVKAAYLPADLMSGNFIDAFYLVDNIYQIVVCDVGSYDAVASFAGATIRTIIRSITGKNLVPSAQIELIKQRLNKVLKDSLVKINIVIYQINTKTSELRMTSLGSLNTLYYIRQKKAVKNLNKTTIGAHHTKRTALKDINLPLSEDDSFLYFSHGVKNATTPDGRNQYGEDKLLGEYSHILNDGSAIITSSLIDSLYTYTDYAPLEEDIILLSIKKHTNG